MGYSPWGHKESDTTERLSLPQVLAIVNSDSTNTGCIYLFGLEFFPDIHLAVGLLGHMLALVSVF